MQAIKNKSSYLFLLATGILFFILSSIYFPLSFTEGVNALTIHFLNKGFHPYTDIYISQMPLFVSFLRAAFAGGENVIPARLVFSLCAWLLAGLIGLVANEFFAEKKVVLIDCLLLVFLPLFITSAAEITDDIPAITLAVSSVLFTLLYLRRNKIGLLWGAGLLLGLGLAVKPQIDVVIVVVILLLTRRIPVLQWTALKAKMPQQNGNLLVVLPIFALGMGLVLFFNGLVFGWTVLLHAITRSTLNLRFMWPIDLAGNSYLLFQFFFYTLILIIGMGMAFFKERRNPQHGIWFLLLWGLISLSCALIFQTPLILLPPMILIAGWGYFYLFSEVIPAFQRKKLDKIPVLWLYLACLALYLIVGAVQVKTLMNEAVGGANVEAIAYHRSKAEAVDFVMNTTQQTDCVITDDPVFVLQSQRYPPPQLGDLSLRRIRAGDLNLDSLEQSIQANQCKALVLASGIFNKKNIPGIWDWAESYFPHSKKFGDITVYYE